MMSDSDTIMYNSYRDKCPGFVNLEKKSCIKSYEQKVKEAER